MVNLDLCCTYKLPRSKNIPIFFFRKFYTSIKKSISPQKNLHSYAWDIKDEDMSQLRTKHMW